MATDEKYRHTIGVQISWDFFLYSITIVFFVEAVVCYDNRCFVLLHIYPRRAYTFNIIIIITIVTLSFIIVIIYETEQIWFFGEANKPTMNRNR